MLLDLVSVIGVPLFVLYIFAVMGAGGLGVIFASVALVVIALWHLRRLGRWFARRGPIALVVIVLMALALPTAAWADFNGTVDAGPIRPGSDSGAGPWAYGRPPTGCRSLTGESIGHHPIPPIDSYHMYARGRVCWSAESWVRGEEYRASGRYFLKPKVQLWWGQHPSWAVDIDLHEKPQVTVRTWGCNIQGYWMPDGCMRITVMARVHVHGIPILHIGDFTTYPWVQWNIAADGEYLGGNWDHDVP